MTSKGEVWRLYAQVCSVDGVDNPENRHQVRFEDIITIIKRKDVSNSPIKVSGYGVSHCY